MIARVAACLRRSPTAGLMAVTLLATPLVWPLLRNQVYCSHDGYLHLYRLVAVRDAIDQGLAFTRWMPNLVYGYGFPFFNFRELLSYYLPELLHLLGMTIPTAVNAVYVGCVLMSGWGSFLLAREMWRSDWSGLLAAAAYMAAPYQMLDIYKRGNLPESMALALLPWILWFFWHWVFRPSRLAFLGAALSWAALLLIHNISSLLFAPLLLGYLALLLLLQPRRNRSTVRWLLLAAPALAGLALTAFAWFPAIAETGNVQLYLDHATRGNDFHYNLASLAELLAAPTPSDPTLLNPPLHVPAGLPQLGLAAVGLVAALKLGDSRRRWLAAALAVTSAGMLFLTLPPSLPLWENLPLIRFVQFPWRLVGRAVLPVALLAGASCTLLSRKAVITTLAGCAVISVMLLAAYPWLYPAACSFPEDPAIGDVMDYERQTGHTGVDPLGAYLPRWVHQRPDGSPMEDALRSGQVARRFESSRLPTGATLLREQYGPNRATIVVDSPSSFEALYHTFFFPGWAVRVDDQKVQVSPAPETGLITFHVPAGMHTIAICWELTPLRATAVAVSLTGLVALLATTSLSGGVQAIRLRWPEKRVACRTWSPVRLSPGQLAAVVLMVTVLVGAKLWLVDAGKTPLRRASLVDESLVGLGPPLVVAPRSFADGLQLLGYHLAPAPAGSELEINLAWLARAQPAGDYETRVILVDAAGLVWSAKESFRPRTYRPHPPTYEWSSGVWAWDSHSVAILGGTPPGRYQLQLTVFDRTTLAPLNLLDPAGNVAGPSAIIGELDVERPASPISSLKMQYRLDRRWSDLTLLGVNLDRREASPGDPVLVTLFWRAEAILPHLTALLALNGPDGATVREWPLELIRDDWPPSNWRVGDELMGQHLLQIPGRAADGTYSWQLTVLDPDGIPLGSTPLPEALEISAPPRFWISPVVAHVTDLAYSDPTGATVARLVGYDLTLQGGTVELRLVWQAMREMETSYRVFVHLINRDGQPVAQSDGVPAGWKRPTPGWAPGEYVVDDHAFAVPEGLAAGEYRLAVGLYVLETGARLSVPSEWLTMVEIP